VNVSVQAAVVLNRQLRDDDHIGSGRFPRGIDSFPEFVEVEERFENDEVNAGTEQRIRLFAKHRANLRE
jgi:hypothetical protein